MNRTGCAVRLLAMLALFLPSQPGPAYAGEPQPRVRLVVQSSPLAGFRYHEARALWPRLAQGDALVLWREADNPHDASAIAVLWQGHKLGYVPRTQNSTLAWAMDRGETLVARISVLREARNPRKRVEFEVFVE